MLSNKRNRNSNIRELRNAVERLIIFSDKKILRKDAELYILGK